MRPITRRCEAKCNSGHTKPAVLFQETRFPPSAYFALLVHSSYNIGTDFQFWYARGREPQTPPRFRESLFTGTALGLLVHHCFVWHVAQI